MPNIEISVDGFKTGDDVVVCKGTKFECSGKIVSYSMVERSIEDVWAGDILALILLDTPIMYEQNGEKCFITLFPVNVSKLSHAE